MLRFLAKRLARAFLTLLICLTAVFMLLRVAGDPATIMLPPETPPDVRALTRELWGLDRPLAEQYFYYLGAVARGDFGRSFADNRPALDIIFETLPNTFLLGFAVMSLELELTRFGGHP